MGVGSIFEVCCRRGRNGELGRMRVEPGEIEGI
jgi:hypothetical protein